MKSLVFSNLCLFYACYALCGCSDIVWYESGQAQQIAGPSVSSSLQKVESNARSEVRKQNAKVHHSAEIVGLYPLGPKEQFDKTQNLDLISVDQSGLVLGWNIAEGQAYQVFQSAETISSSAFYADGAYLALAQRAGVSVVTLSSGASNYEGRFRSRLQSLSFSPNGNAILAASADGNVFRWRWNDQRIERGRDFERYSGHSSVVSAVAYHPYGRVIFSADWQGVISAWLSYDSDIYSGRYDHNTFGDLFFSEKARRMKAQVQGGKAVDHLRLTSDGKWLIVGLQEGEIELWEVRGLRKAVSTKAAHGLIYDIAIDSSNSLMASATRDNKVRIWRIDTSDADKATVTQIREFTLKDCLKLSFSQAARSTSPALYAGMHDGTVLVLDIDSQSAM